MVDLSKFFELRAKLFKVIEKALEEDGHCKSYEGAMSIHFPSYFKNGLNNYVIHLDCYVIGPNRHYDWNGKTFEEALNKATVDIEQWIKESNYELNQSKSI